MDDDDPNEIDAEEPESPRRSSFAVRVCIVQLAAFAGMFILLMRVLPKCEKVFLKHDLTLPVVSQWTIEAGNYFGSYWFLVLAVWIMATAVLIVVERFLDEHLARILHRTAIIGTVAATFVFVVGMLLPMVELLK